MTEMSNKIWGYAELGLRETKSSKLISDELEKHSFKLMQRRWDDQPPLSPSGARVGPA
jgi:metal-dependent amidase/aminoacylase/carboxypeptidase family protein